MAIALSKLFERKRFVRAYPSVRAELAAVRDGQKAMAFEMWPRDRLDNADYRELCAIALEFDLAVVHQPAGKRRDSDVYVYVLHPEQSWRISAHRALHATYVRDNGRWSDGAEALESTLLGYRESQIAAWLAAKRHERLGWGAQTVFLLLDAEQRALVGRVRGRYLGHGVLDRGVTAFVATGDRVIRRDAHRLVGDGTTLARIAVAWPYFRRTFGTSAGKRRIVTKQLGARHADALDSALEERVEMLGDRGWAAIER